jgi:GTPase
MNLIELSSRKRNNGDWEPQIVETEAIKGRGIEQLYEAIEKHKNHLRSTHTDKWREVLEKRARIQLIGAIRDEALKTILERIEGHGDSLDEMVQKVVDKESDPYTLVQQILDRELK